MSGLRGAAAAVVDRAWDAYPGHDPDAIWARTVLADARERLERPLRVALAGTLKAGKSTLLNALVGERIAATDAGECTRLVTWYRDAPAAAVHRDGPAGRRPVPFRRGAAGLEIDLSLDGAVPGPEDRLVVDWPSRGLAAATLVDTPGLDSLDAANSARATAFVTPEDRPSAADVVVYLMRHAHRADIGFLEAFADLARGGSGAGGSGAGGSAAGGIGLGAVGAAGTVVVLSRADEIGGGRPDALTTAGQVARAYRADPVLRSLCQTVVAVDGLLAETARTLRQPEFTALRALARAPRGEVDAMLLSADRFAAPEPPAAVREALAADPEGASVADARVRSALLERLGVYGVRVATAALRRGARSGGTDSAALAEELVRRSGLAELREVLATRVTGRADVHQARSALLAVDRVLRRAPRASSASVTVELERILTGAHEFVEERVLATLRAGDVRLADDAGPEAERLLGGDGPGAAQRLGLEAPSHADAPADATQVREAALEALDRWRTRAESPLTARAGAEVARAVVRSLEGVLAAR